LQNETNLEQIERDHETPYKVSLERKGTGCNSKQRTQTKQKVSTQKWRQKTTEI